MSDKTDKTLGQVAYEAKEAYHGFDGSKSWMGEDEGEQMIYSDSDRAGWEAAAQAVRARVLAEPRIAACLAACDGISTEALEAGGKIRDRMQAIMDAVTEHAAEVLEQDAKMRAALQAAAAKFRDYERHHRDTYETCDYPTPQEAARRKMLENAALAALCESALSGASVPASPWTREPPTEPGWYWYQISPHTLPRAMSVYVSSIHKTLGVLIASGFVRLSDIPGWWQGPIAPHGVPPELPKEIS